MIKTAITGPWRFAVYLLIAVGYFVLGYFTARDQTMQLVLIYLFLFVIYLLFIGHFNSPQLIREGIALALFLRLLLLFCMPALSDDFYRFIWDGTLINNGVNPFQYKPDEIMQFQLSGEQLNGITNELYHNINSKIYYSVYPPVCQAIFSTTTFLSGNNIYLNVILMKLIIILFEAGTIYFLLRIIRHFNIKPGRILVYALNPLIIIELTANIHFEAGMIFFMTLAFYLLLQQKYLFSAVLFGLAVSIKLFPLIFIPFLFKYIGFKRTVVYSCIVGCVTILTFLPFLNDAFIAHITTSINLYFNEFEHNASFYYLGKWLGGWNDLEVKLFLQDLFPILTLVCISALAFFYKREHFFTACLMAAGIYFLFATTIHPWYIAILVMFTTITSHFFVVCWTALIILTYTTYQTPLNLERFELIVLEYLIVFSILIYELMLRKNPGNQTSLP